MGGCGDAWVFSWKGGVLCEGLKRFSSGLSQFIWWVKPGGGKPRYTCPPDRMLHFLFQMKVDSPLARSLTLFIVP
jgi:hypothetical protein